MKSRASGLLSRKKPQRRARRIAVSALCGTLAILSGINVAHALWADSGQSIIPPFNFGSVSFGVRDLADDTDATLAMSQQGEAVQIVIPGSVISQVGQQRGVNPLPVIFRFEVMGWAHGIAGMDYIIETVAQITGEGHRVLYHDGQYISHPLESTFLFHSYMSVYPASIGGDCVGIGGPYRDPAIMSGETYPLLVGSNEDPTVLQLPAVQVPPPDHISTNIWCVEFNFRSEDDGWYANDVFAVGYTEDSRLLANIAHWYTHVAFPPSLPALGEYWNIVNAWGRAADDTQPEARDEWWPTVFPDPDVEPDVVITIQPHVTSIRDVPQLIRTE